VTIAAPDERNAATTSDTGAVLPNVGITICCLLSLLGSRLCNLLRRGHLAMLR
jgi:hypothetical protein